MRKVGLAALLLVICSLGAVPAKADHIVSYLTGDFGYRSGDYGGDLQGWVFDLNGYFGFSSLGTVTSTEQTHCDQQGNCATFYWINFRGGTATVTATLQDNSVITLNGVGFNGEIVGEILWCYDGCGSQDETSTYVFRGFWSNGWYSAVKGSESWDYYFGSEGDLSIRTQTTPEPSSIALLGSGVLGLIGYGRKLSSASGGLVL